MKTFLFSVVAFLFFCPSPLLAQISVTGSGPYFQDFNSLVTFGSSSNLPDGWHIYETGLNANSEYTAGNGGSTSADTYSFGLNSDSDRALGSVRGAALNPTFGAHFINNSGDEITLLYISYWGEQWRVGVTGRNDADRLDFQYSLDATGLSNGTWIDVDELDLYSLRLNTSSGSLNGNSSENRTELTSVITGLSIPSGAEFWIRWTDYDISGSDDGLAVDDFQLDISVPEVLFSISPASLDFGNVTIGQTASLQATISNNGLMSNLEISSALSDNPVFTTSLNTFPIIIPPGADYSFDINFTADQEGQESGTITFLHNAPGSPSLLTVSGIGISQSQGGTLRFKSESKDLFYGSFSNQDTIVLASYSGQPLKALQFNLLVGKTNGKLVLKSVSRGAAIPAGQFNFSYEIYQGQPLADGTSIDTVKVVILGNGSNVIQPDTGEQDILIFSYDIPGFNGQTSQTYNGLAGVSGATSHPVMDANITPGPDQEINIFSGTLLGLLGDINFDEAVNILDILTMIDHLLGRVEFTPDQFEKADIAPWEEGDPLPSPDGIINVLDLAMLQNIVVTGQYPNGANVNKQVTLPNFNTTAISNKITPGMNAKLTLYLTEDGITVGLETLKKVKGLQLELDQLPDMIPQNTKISSVFDQAFFHQNNKLVRIISYDGHALPIEPGEFIAAKIPFQLSDPTEIIIKEVIIADENNALMSKIETEILYDDPIIVYDYNLFQNFPNPFNPMTTIHFSLPTSGNVNLIVYDILGNEVAELVNGVKESGLHSVVFDAKDLSSGVYFYKMKAGDFSSTKKMLLLK